MLNIDKWTKGFAPQLTQRQTRMIAARLKGEDVMPEDEAYVADLIERFDGQAQDFAQARGELTGV